MTLGLLLVLFILILIAEIGLLIYKIYKITKKFDKLYDYFIRPEKNLKEGNNVSFRGIPPVNGECPTKEELDNFEP